MRSDRAAHLRRRRVLRRRRAALGGLLLIVVVDVAVWLVEAGGGRSSIATPSPAAPECSTNLTGRASPKRGVHGQRRLPPPHGRHRPTNQSSRLGYGVPDHRGTIPGLLRVPDGFDILMPTERHPPTPQPGNRQFGAGSGARSHCSSACRSCLGTSRRPGKTARGGAGEGVEQAARVNVERDADGGRDGRPQPDHAAWRGGETSHGRVPVR